VTSQPAFAGWGGGPGCCIYFSKTIQFADRTRDADPADWLWSLLLQSCARPGRRTAHSGADSSFDRSREEL